MSENSELRRSERIARYKEERRRQLNEQFSSYSRSSPKSKIQTTPVKDGNSSNSSDSPRQTIASKLRAAASSHKLTSDTSEIEPKIIGSKRIERDKSNKRKSNLNRSLNSEEVPSNELNYPGDVKDRRRRRRFFPAEIFDSSVTNSGSEKDRSDLSSTASITSPSITSNTAVTTPSKLTHKKSDLSEHMENARKSITSSYSETGKYKPYASRMVTSSPKSSINKLNEKSQPESPHRLSSYNQRRNASDDEKTKAIAGRMEGLSALTKQTLARVERLTNKTRESPKKSLEQSASKQTDQKTSSKNSKKPESEKSLLFSILKKNSVEEAPAIVVDHPNLLCAAPTVGPVSILKRKVSQDSSKQEHASNNTPPVTFSPSVLEPTTTRRKQGILKKRRSLDESTVMRHRSCSPDVVNKAVSSNSILKTQRRSSLEELHRTQSPETHLQGILKRRTSKYDDDDQSLNSPQSILKRKSGASSASSTGSSPHVSITTAVILAAAGGAEMVLDSDAESVRPILKKKSFSDEHSHHNEIVADVPKPILKKKSSTDTDEAEEKPKPILKIPRTSLELETLETTESKPSSETECEVKPILKQAGREESARRLSFRASFSENQKRENTRLRTSRRSNTICSDFEINSIKIRNSDVESDLMKPRPFSVSELVRSFEQTISTGAVPKRSHHKRSNRHKTQPVTIDELEASRSFVKKRPQPLNDNSSNQNSFTRSCDLGLASSMDKNDGDLKCFSSSIRNQDSPESMTCEKLSSDSAFQSLGDGLELELVDESLKESEPDENKLQSVEEYREIQMRLLETKENSKLDTPQGNVNRNRYRRTRHGTNFQFLTQPVTFEEIKAAAKMASDNINLMKENPTDDNKSPITHNLNIKSIRTGVSPDKDDEGISCNDSGSSSDSDNSPKKGKKGNWIVEGILSKFGGDSTSEGESSGGREIKSIFKKDNILKMKQKLEGGLVKSKSQESLGNDTELSKNTQAQTKNKMPQPIADLRAKLQIRGESDWKKRVPQNNNASDELKLLKEKNRNNDELNEKSLLSAKKDELDAASKHWKSRVEKSDAEKFSVAGRMNQKINSSGLSINLPSINNSDKKIPQPKTFKLKEGSNSASTSPELSKCDLFRSNSARYSFTSTGFNDSPNITKKSVTVLNPNDITVQTFFTSYDQISNEGTSEFSLEDFDAIQRRQSLLVMKKNVKVQRRRGASNNPIKALASRTDIANEYTEVLTGVAEREKKRLNIEKLAKNSDKALEALAGLISNEDFKAVALKKSSGPIGQVPWKDTMLLQIKGRRHVQTRLVEPVASSINEGDNFILISSNTIYVYIGAYSNVIEQSRTSDILNHIKKTGDLGCKGSKIHTISTKEKNSKYVMEFWKILGEEEIPKTVDAGHPDEDETYESNILLTNMIYTLDNEELVPCDKYWGSIPKIEMLKDTSIYVFDFGSEMYVWSGKNASSLKKKIAMKVAQEMWSDGYNYSDCNVCPLNVAKVLGTRSQEKLPLQSNSRPKWALFAKLTQHRETILFKEKFLDWPDYSRIIRVKSHENLSRTPSFDIQPCDVKEMLRVKDTNPDLIVDNIHMGRGDEYFDEETRRLFRFETTNITGWRILESSYEKLPESTLCQFYNGDSYIFRWNFRQTVRGRELNGNPSKHAPVGRDRSIFFYWQGSNSSIKEKGLAALLTVELDTENARQVRIAQGAEPAAFLQLFNGNMVVNWGKRDTKDSKIRLFILRGEKENEIYLMEVPPNMKSLRSRSSFVLFNLNDKQALIWHGAKSSPIKQKGIKSAVDNLIKSDASNTSYNNLRIIEVTEGSEPENFLNILGNDRTSYHSLLDYKEPFDHTIRLFKMCSLTGNFLATEILCPHRSNHCSPYPFVQTELYSASQPALFLIDNHYDLWLWQGFIPENNLEDDGVVDHTGFGSVRWQAERKAAMQTAVQYWKKKHESKPIEAYIVSAGLEPVEFKSLFPVWEDHLEAAELNKKLGKSEGEMLSLEKELALLSRTTYPLSDLLQRPLPEGVDPTNIEKYLSTEDFEELLLMTKDEFDKLPLWKKTVLKKEKGLF